MKRLLYDVLAAHLLWLETDEECGELANLYGANLRGADLREANLDFSSGVPLHCGGTQIKGDKRLFAQMLYHLTRQDWSEAGEDVQKALAHITADPSVDWFCEYRDDVKPLLPIAHKEAKGE